MKLRGEFPSSLGNDLCASIPLLLPLPLPQQLYKDSLYYPVPGSANSLHVFPLDLYNFPVMKALLSPFHRKQNGELSELKGLAQGNPASRQQGPEHQKGCSAMDDWICWDLLVAQGRAKWVGLWPARVQRLQEILAKSSVKTRVCSNFSQYWLEDSFCLCLMHSLPKKLHRFFFSLFFCW